MNREEIVSRVKTGEKLRWVPRYISCVKALGFDKNGDMRDCFLGRQRLTEDEELEVVEMCRKGILFEKQDGPICIYSLKE